MDSQYNRPRFPHGSGGCTDSRLDKSGEHCVGIRHERIRVA